MIFQTEFDPEKFGNKFLGMKKKLTSENSRMETVCFCENFGGGKKEIQLASEIAESKKPYKEIEALINKSRLVLRTQKLAPAKDRDKEKEKKKDTNTKNKILGNFTDKPVRLLLTEVKNDGNKVTSSKIKSPKINESIKNTNAYLLRIKKTESWDENIDLQLRIPSVSQNCL